MPTLGIYGPRQKGRWSVESKFGERKLKFGGAWQSLEDAQQQYDR